MPTALPPIAPCADARLRALPRLPMAVPRSGVSAEARRALRQLLGDVDRDLAMAFRDGIQAAVLACRRAEAVQRVVAHAWTACLGEVDGTALFAVGGFGRGLLFPYSDVDLLVLVEHADASRLHALEQYFTTLWDLGLKLGHAVRDSAQCRALAAREAAVFTSLLDARRIAGAPALDAALRSIVDDPQLWPPAAYLAARRAERDARHARCHDSAYNLEPNLKEGPGGLRTLDSLHWLGLRLAHAGDFAAMVVEGLIDPAEQATLEAAQATLYRYRFALHLEARRPEERLLFDYQRALAARLGFVDEDANLAVEQFMQGYYRAASQVERLGVQIVERFEEMLEPAAKAVPVGADFLRSGLRLALRDPAWFDQRPSALVQAFLVRLDHPDLTGFTADTMRRVHHAVALHQATMANDGPTLAAFLRLLRYGAPAARVLWQMNRHGVLAAIIPAFGRVFGRMQYDLFHVYTVDEHTMRVLANVARFADPAARADFPLACDIWPTLPAPEVMLLAALFHDIAKGRGGDHSLLGEQDARDFCTRLGLPANDTKRVAWLVRWHLLMSATAQRQDIADPEVVQRFAAAVESRERLDQLYLLTIADIIGTSPKLWNSWKARLLADLYTATRYALCSALRTPRDAAERVAECQRYALPLLEAEGFGEAPSRRVWASWPDASFLRHRPEQVAWQTAMILRAPHQLPLVAVQPVSIRGSTELFVYAVDRDGLFADVTAMLERLRFSVMEARVLSSVDGMALDTFLLLEADTQRPASPLRAEELQRGLARALQQPGPVHPTKRGLSRQLRHFQAAPRICFNQAGPRTQLALTCTNRPGLLAVVAQALHAAHVRVHDARIATFGERVEDFFLLTDRADRPLGQNQRSRLEQALHSRLD